MTIFDATEKVEFIAAQAFHYDNYSESEYYLERVDVNGKCGLVCVEKMENGNIHSRVVLQPTYSDIQIRKISTAKANYDRYAIFSDGKKLGDFTMVLNEWMPLCNN